MMVIAADVAVFLGKLDDPNVIELAGAHLPVITAQVKAYVQGNGWTGTEPDDDLAAVIISSCARYVGNPTGTVAETAGPFTVRYGVFNGWTLPELAILHTYRKRAA